MTESLGVMLPLRHLLRLKRRKSPHIGPSFPDYAMPIKPAQPMV